VSNIRKNNGSVVDKTASLDWSRQRILDWSMGDTGAHSVLLTTGISGLDILCEAADSKQR